MVLKRKLYYSYTMHNTWSKCKFVIYIHILTLYIVPEKKNKQVVWIYDCTWKWIQMSFLCFTYTNIYIIRERNGNSLYIYIYMYLLFTLCLKRKTSCMNIWLYLKLSPNIIYVAVYAPKQLSTQRLRRLVSIWPGSGSHKTIIGSKSSRIIVPLTRRLFTKMG